MTTIHAAIQSALQPNCTINILCKIVSITLYKSRDEATPRIIIIFCDEVGFLIEAATMNGRKVDSFYREFQPNDEVVLTCLASNLMQPQTDSAARKGCYKLERNWLIAKNRALFADRDYFSCFVDIEEFRSARPRKKMLVGVFVRQTYGPKVYDNQGDLIATSSYLALRDSKNRSFRAQVWECVNEIAAPGWIESFRPGDLVLLPYAQEHLTRETGSSSLSSVYTVVTMHQPVPNSECVGERVEKALVKTRHHVVASQVDPRRHTLALQLAA